MKELTPREEAKLTLDKYLDNLSNEEFFGIPSINHYGNRSAFLHTVGNHFFGDETVKLVGSRYDTDGLDGKEYVFVDMNMAKEDTIKKISDKIISGCVSPKLIVFINA